MSLAIHLASNGVAGYGHSDGRCRPCSGVSGRAVSISPCLPHCDYRTLTQVKTAPLKCSSGGRFYLCQATTGGHRRNPDFSKQSKHGFSRSRNRQNEERDGFDNSEEPEPFSSRNGPLHTLTSTSKFQATATPGPREKEIVELFRKVQAQLRERAAVKEEKKIENRQAKGRENETVDSLLKLLRKHSVQQGKRKSSREFTLDQPEHNVSVDEERSSSFINLNNTVKDDVEEREAPFFSRPISNFQRRSPVRRAKFQSTHSEDNTVNSISSTNFVRKGDKTRAEPKIERESKLEIEPEPELEPELEPESESTFSVEDVFVGIQEDGISDTDEGYGDNDAEEPDESMNNDLSTMKLAELRALAKSRGMKGFSKLKKLDLVEFLRGGAI